MEEENQGSKRKIAIIVLTAVAVTALIAGGVLITAYKLKGNAPKPDDPQLVTAECAYQQYEIRNNELLLSYRITLSNPSDKELSGFRIDGVFDKDFESGLILDSNAPAREKLTGSETFSLSSGETKSYDLVFVASYFRNTNKPSQTLPSVIITTADGREIEISAAE